MFLSLCSDPQLNMDDSSSDTSRGHARKPSGSSSTSSPLHTPGHAAGQHLSASNPDLSSIGLSSDDGRSSGSEYPEHVLKIYRADQTCKYILLHRVSTHAQTRCLCSRTASCSCGRKHSVKLICYRTVSCIRHTRV